MSTHESDWIGDNDPAINGRGLWECPDCGYQTDVQFVDGTCPFCEEAPMKVLVMPR